MTIARTFVLSSAFIVATVLLAGCVPSEPVSSPTSNISEAATPEVEVGQVIDADAADALEPPLHGYPLPDGTFVVVNRDEPLPDSVQADLDSQVTAYADAITPETYLDSGESQIKAIIGSASLNTGKRVVMIARIEGIRTASGNENIQTWYWAWGAGNINGDAGFDTVDAAVSAARDWIAQTDEPSAWALIVPHQ